MTVAQFGSNPTHLLNLNGLLVLAADDGTRGVEVNRSNGPVPDTVRVKDMNPGVVSSNLGEFFNLNSTLFFWENDTGPTAGSCGELRASASGSLMAADINPGAGSSNPAQLGGRLTRLFSATNSGTSGLDLWTLSNPASGGAAMPQGSVEDQVALFEERLGVGPSDGAGAGLQPAAIRAPLQVLPNGSQRCVSNRKRPTGARTHGGFGRRGSHRFRNGRLGSGTASQDVVGPDPTGRLAQCRA